MGGTSNVSSDAITEVSDVKVSDEDGFLTRDMKIKASKLAKSAQELENDEDESALVNGLAELHESTLSSCEK